MNNFERAQWIIKKLTKYGVKDFCICSGARNGPLVYTVEDCSELNVFSFFDERAASFFALGRMLSSGRPVAVITTSGTAVGELLPACMEAYYQGLPLFLLTADRPFSYRGTGAPQSVEQANIFGIYAHKTLDIDIQTSVSDVWSEFESEVGAGLLSKPLHVNVAFSEPVLEGSAIPKLSVEVKAPACDYEKPDQSLKKSSLNMALNPLVIVSGLTPFEAKFVREFLVKNQLPVILEAGSQLLGTEVSNLALAWSQKQLMQAFSKSVFKSVIRIGSVPTHRVWRDLELSLQKIPVFNFTAKPWSGLSRPVEGVWSIAALSQIAIESNEEFRSILKASNVDVLRNLCLKFPNSEQNFIAEILKTVGANESLYVGNSLPIREVDLMATLRIQELRVFTHRGANGIDGQISSFYGSSVAGQENWALVGDLTALYDMQAPWILPQLGEIKTRLFIMNNSGGQIFAKLFPRPSFLNSHKLGFESWAQMFGLSYVQINCQDSFHNLKERLSSLQHVVIECLPNLEETHQWGSDFESLG